MCAFRGTNCTRNNWGCILKCRSTDIKVLVCILKNKPTHQDVLMMFYFILFLFIIFFAFNFRIFIFLFFFFLLKFHHKVMVYRIPIKKNISIFIVVIWCLLQRLHWMIQYFNSATLHAIKAEGVEISGGGSPDINMVEVVARGGKQGGTWRCDAATASLR